MIDANTNIHLDERSVLIGTNFLSIELEFLDYLMSETDGGKHSGLLIVVMFF